MLWRLCDAISWQGVKQETFAHSNFKQEVESEHKPPNNGFPASELWS